MKWLNLNLNERQDRVIPYVRPVEYVRAREKVAAYAKVKSSELVLTNGSAHALEIIFPTLFGDQDILLLPVPTFTFYTRWQKLPRLRIEKIPYRAGFSVQDITRRLRPGVKAVYLANPNNPIGYIFSLAEIIKLVKAARRRRTVAVIDEAYFEFSKVTAKSLIRRFPNLIIVRTFSKAFGLTGLRAGYIITNSRLAALLETLRGPSYHLSRPGIEKIIALNSAEISRMKNYVAKIRLVKKRFGMFLQKHNIRYWPATGNFMTIQVPDANRLAKELKKRKILISDLTDYPDRGQTLKNCVRVTIPLPRELPRLEKALAEILG